MTAAREVPSSRGLMRSPMPCRAHRLRQHSTGPCSSPTRWASTPTSESNSGASCPSGGTVTLLGGTAALDQRVEADIEALGLSVRRIAGDTRITTAIAVADRLEESGELSALLITTGFDFPDALTAGTAAAAIGDTAVLLTNDGTRSQELDDYLEQSSATTYAIGGPAVLAYPDATALAGATREGTAIAVAEAFFDDPSTVALARRDGFADALAGGALAAARNAPLLLSGVEALGSDNLDYLCSAASVDAALLLGGENALSEDVDAAVTGAIQGSGCQ